MVTPPGVSERNFKKALEEFSSIIGSDWVFSDPADTEMFKDVYSIFQGTDLEPEIAAAIAPDSTEEVVEIVKVANKYQIPLYPISTGKNLGYGGSSPILSGSVVLDLKRMNRILNVDVRNHTVLVEPGVSFFDLIAYFRENNLPLDMDIPDPAWGSPIGHALDRGVGHTYSDHGRDRWDSICGMEVVLGNGEIIRTGAGACEGTKMWQDHKWGIGPALDGIFSQSNFGIVTKMGMWVRPRHEGYRSLVMHCPKHEDVYKMVDLDSRLQNAGIVNGMSVMGSQMWGGGLMLNLPMPTSEQRRLLASPDGKRPDVAPLEKYALENKIPAWSLEVKWHMPNSISEASKQYVIDLFQKEIPGSWAGEEHVLDWPLDEEEMASFKGRPGHPELVNVGIPSLFRFGMGARFGMRDQDNQGHFWFAPMVPKKAEELLKYQEVMTEWHIKNERNMMMGSYYGNFPMFWHKRVGVGLASWTIRSNPETNMKTLEQYIELTQVCAENGWTEYRAPAPVHDQVTDIINNWNDGSLKRVHETIKDAIDPNGILSAGRYGIWPEYLREERKKA